MAVILILSLSVSPFLSSNKLVAKEVPPTPDVTESDHAPKPKALQHEIVDEAIEETKVPKEAIRKNDIEPTALTITSASVDDPIVQKEPLSKPAALTLSGVQYPIASPPSIELATVIDSPIYPIKEWESSDTRIKIRGRVKGQETNVRYFVDGVEVEREDLKKVLAP